MLILLLLSLAFAIGSMAAARSPSLHASMFEGYRRRGIGGMVDESVFNRLMRFVFVVMAAMSILIGIAALVELIAGRG